MRQDIKEAWVSALRSGEYPQDKGALHRTYEDGAEGYCCLGVLCEVAIEHGLALDVAEDNYGHIAYNGFAGMPPEAVWNWLELDPNKMVARPEPARPELPNTTSEEVAIDILAMENDLGKSFVWIADYLEKNF